MQPSWFASPFRGAFRRTASLLVVLALFAAPAASQTLPALLPADVEAAVGLIDLASAQERVEPFLAEAERLGLVDALLGAVPGASDLTAGDDASRVPSAFDGLGLLDLLGTEAWIAVTASPFDPLPSVTLIARTSPAARDAFATAFAQEVDRPGTRVLEEAGRTFFTFVPDGQDSGEAAPSGFALGLPVAYAQVDDVVVASTDPETLRFVLRAVGGTTASTFADHPSWQELVDLGPGQVVGFLDPLPLTRSLEPLAASSGAGALLSRVQGALATAGPSVGSLAADDTGLVTVGRQTPDAAGPDAALYALLTEGTAPSLEVLRFAPDDTVSVSAGTFDVPGWWAWLDDLLASAASFGLPTATDALALVGLDADGLLLDWAGDGWVQLQTAPLTTPEPALAGESLLGDQLLMVRSRDDAAARRGLQEGLAVVGATLAGFLDPSGAGMAVPDTVDVAGVPVTRLVLSDTLTIDAAVVDGWVLLSGSPQATERVLLAYAAGEAGPSDLTRLAADLPDDLRSWSLAKAPSGDATSADALIGQLQMLAGLGGAATLDFEAVDRATEAVTAYAAYLGERTGASVAWTRIDEGTLIQRQRISLTW